MTQKNIIRIVFLLTIIVFASCNNKDKFLIEKGKVGLIHSKTTLSEAKELFKKDSISSYLKGSIIDDEYFQGEDKYQIFEKGGNHLLTIIPKDSKDSLSLIKSIEIHDKRFVTKNGINLSSNFSQINANYSLRVESTLLSVTLFLDELNATITIDKDELGLQDVNFQKVSLAQIPDLATIKSFVIWFD